MKKNNIVISVFLSLTAIALLALPARADERTVKIYFFWGEGCPHCANERIFLDQLPEKYSNLRVMDYEVWNNAENRAFLQKAGAALGVDISGVPFTVIGERAIVGYFNEATTGVEIEQAAVACLSNDCPDPLADILSGEKPEPSEKTAKPESNGSIIPKSVNVPLFGTVQTEHLSLPIFTIILGALDGFNPCAMWTLIFLIGLLVGMKDRKRMWVLGSAFIVASAAVYFMFMAAWLNLLLFLGAISWIRLIIGFLALGGGLYYFTQYFSNKDSACKVTGQEKRRRVFEKLKRYTQEKSYWLALGGIVVLAMAVNLVELVCSAGLPAIYTQVLALSDLATWQYYAYLLLYLLVFLLDDLFVFFVAMKTLQVAGLTTKYARASHLIGGIIMVAIGILLLFKPELLMFG